MKQELTVKEETTIASIWLDDISQGGAPDGWDLAQFRAKVEDQMYNGLSLRGAIMYLLARVPRPDDPKPKKVQESETILAKVAELKAEKIRLFKEQQASRKANVKN